MKFGMYDLGHWPIIININHDIGLTLINLTSTSNMVMKAFESSGKHVREMNTPSYPTFI